MRIKVCGANSWGGNHTFIHQDLLDAKIPTPISTYDIYGKLIYSEVGNNTKVMNKHKGRIVNGEVELREGDYVMVLMYGDLQTYKERACGHMHYFDGEQLYSVYSYKPLETKEEFKQRELEENKVLKELELIKSKKELQERYGVKLPPIGTYGRFK